MTKDKTVILRSNSPEDQRAHFIERLRDRYNIVISNNEYDNLCNPKGVFHGAFSKQRRKTIGWIFIQGVKVWVLRDGELNRLATCYPPDVEYSDIEMIRACFGSSSKSAALHIHSIYLKEAVRVSKIKFGSIKEAALYFFTKTNFAPLHIDKYKHGSVWTVKVATVINKILCGESEYVEICLRRIKNKADAMKTEP